MKHTPTALMLIVLIGLLVEACAMERPGGWISDRGSIGGAIRDPLTHELVE